MVYTWSINSLWDQSSRDSEELRLRKTVSIIVVDGFRLLQKKCRKHDNILLGEKFASQVKEITFSSKIFDDIILYRNAMTRYLCYSRGEITSGPSSASYLY
jgi:hypothetical protein